MEETSKLLFFVNGKKIVDDNVDPEYTLIQYLRQKLLLCGTKLGCAEGGCGACTVMLSRYNHIDDVIEHISVNACLYPIGAVHGTAVTTVEGIGSTRTALHPVQERIAKAHGTQCGFCTPGFVMSMYTLLRNNSSPSVENIQNIFQGNICRCTGYRPILEGFKSFAKDGGCCGGAVNGQCCKQVNGVNGGKAINGVNGVHAVNGVNGINGDYAHNGVNGVNGDDGVEHVKAINFQALNGVNEVHFVNGINGDHAINGVNGVNGHCHDDDSDDAVETSTYSASGFAPYDPSQELIFPPELKLSPELDEQFLVFKSQRVQWIRPNSMKQLLDLKSEFPQAKLVVGNTEVGVEVLFKNNCYPVQIAPTAIPELRAVSYNDDGITVGAGVTISEFDKILRKAISNQPESKTRIFVAMTEILQLFAGNQIRNVASIAGNIMTASQLSDLNPLLLAADCTLRFATKGQIVSKSDKKVRKKRLDWILRRNGNGENGGEEQHEEREMKMDSGFFTGFRRTSVNPQDVLVSVHVPFTYANEYYFAYKHSRRLKDDIAIVNAGMKVRFQPGSNVIQDLRIAYGGMAPTTVMATKTMTTLVGKKWDDSLVDQATSLISEDLPLAPGAFGGMTEYRRTLATSLFFKFYLQVLEGLESAKIPSLTSKVDAKTQSACAPYKNIIPKSSQIYQMVAPGQQADDPVGRPEVHKSALEQATGEAVFCDDIPSYPHELDMVLVASTRAHAKILSIDASEALAVEGIRAFFCHRHLTRKENNIVTDEEIFASSVVNYQGQTIGALVGKDRNTVKRASKLIKVKYEDIKPVVITIEDAIANNWVRKEYSLLKTKGDITKGFSESEHILEGEVRTGAQEHFYMEPHSALAVPTGEHKELTVYSSSQFPSGVQHAIAEALSQPANRIVVKVKRIGGGFGGKDARCQMVAVPCAIAAQRLNRPVRLILDRDEDMATTGTRHPFLGKYKVGFSSEGKINALEVQMNANIGFSIDYSDGVISRSMDHVENAYCVPHMRVEGHLYKSNIASCTAFRGFGAPQGMLVAETMMEHIAITLGLEPAKIRKLNFYQEGDITHYNQVIPSDALTRCWEECVNQSDYFQRQKQVHLFNAENRWRKRGLALIPTKFGVTFNLLYIMQAGALVHAYQDGSVLLTHGGTEMGQGLNTKMIQIASRALGIPSEKIHISEMSTDKIPNATGTSSVSMCSDLYGTAVLNACETLKQRLEPVIYQNPKGTWDDWVKEAYMQRINLSATGFHKSGDTQDKREMYFTNGVCCTEVELDCLTGFHQVLRTDIVMDVGQSINPAIDIGQIEGGYMQGYGMFVLEELRHSPEGYLKTRGPGTYKVPTMNEIPTELNVFLLKGSTTPRTIFSSKAIGEPPVFLAAAVFFALKDAIREARKEEGIDGHFSLVSPATCERIRMACTDKFTKKFPLADPKSFTPRSVMA